MGLKRRIELGVYRIVKPLSRDAFQAPQLPARDEPDREITRPSRGPVSILRSKAAAVIMTAALAGGGGVLIGGYVADQGSEAQLAAAHDKRMTDWRESAEWRAEHDVCLARAEARATPDAGIFSVTADPELDQCYADQAAKVAGINARASQ